MNEFSRIVSFIRHIMHRLILILILALTPILCAQTSEPDIIEQSSEWQQKWSEESLHQQVYGDRVYREILGAAFCGSVLARLTIKADGTGDLVLKVPDFTEGIEHPAILARTRKLDASDVSKFLSLVEKAEFWALPPHAPRRTVDGAMCTLEAMDNGKYHGVQREVPSSENTRFGEACSYFLQDALTRTCHSRREALDRSRAVQFLSQTHSEIKWEASSAIVGDFDCDGKPDTVVLGTQGNKVAVGVVWGTREKKEDIFTFALSSANQDGFCAVPKRVELAAHDCDSDDGTLSGCKSSRSCKDFRVVDDTCDSFNFYWDVEHKRLGWWRR